jgi:hypothetical protein
MTMIRRALIVPIVFVLIGPLDAVGEGDSPKQSDELSFSDCHIHLLNFLQQGEFDNGDRRFPASRRGEIERQRYLTPSAGERWRRISALLENMRDAHVDHAMICGMPVLKKWSEIDNFERPDGYLDNESHVVLARDTDLAIAAAVLDYREKFCDDDEKLRQLARVAPFLCGIDPTDLGAVDLVVERIKEFPGVWQGIGEVMSRHDDLTNLSLGERPRSNHPALLRVCKFAGENYLPVGIHHNIAPVSVPGVSRPPAYLDELVDLFRFCHEEPDSQRPSTVFIWCHAGASRRVHVDKLPYWIGEVLSAFGDQVYIDLSWVVLDEYIRDDVDTWATLIDEYPSQFMLGSDVVGSTSSIGEKLREYRPLLKKLDPKTRRLVARDNFRNLIKRMAELRRTAGLSGPDGDGVVLPVDYTFPEYAHTRRLRDDESFVRSRLKREKIAAAKSRGDESGK